MNKFLRLNALAVVAVMVTVLVAGTVNAALRTSPVFNAYNNVQLHYGVGAESDFLRLGKSGEFGNTLEACQDGQLVDLWFYVHNSTAESANGANFDGPGVATGTVVALAVNDDQVARSHSVFASIDSDQTNAIRDGVTITCADKDISLTYKKISHFGTPAPASAQHGNFSLVGDLRQGASLGYTKGDTSGIVPGCWQYRARINVQLQVNVVEPAKQPEQPEPEKEQPEPETPEIPVTGFTVLDPTLATLVMGSAATAAFGYRAATSRRR